MRAWVEIDSAPEGRVKVTAISAAENSLCCHGDGVVFNIPPHGQKLPAGL